MRVAITGFGTKSCCRLRGSELAEEMGIPYINTGLPMKKKWDTLVFVSRTTSDDGTNVSRKARKNCERLIFDPVCPFTSDSHSWGLRKFWKHMRKKVKFDDIIGTSPSCCEAMKSGMVSHGVFCVPVNADIRIKNHWRDRNGPVVYAGCLDCLGESRDKIDLACRAIGKKFIADKTYDSWKSLQGASVVLHLRLGKTSKLTRHCKPQIKQENAAAAGIPCVATDHPCVRSVRDESKGMIFHSRKERWEDEILKAIDSDPPSSPRTIQENANQMWRIIRNG